MLLMDQHPNNKSLMVGILGVPNVGKSTLINSILGFHLTAVTSKPQTTRNKYHCVYKEELTEVIFVDTPGLHSSNVEMNVRMNALSVEALQGTDMNLLLVDITQDSQKQLQDISKQVGDSLGDTWLVITKKDLYNEKKHSAPEEVLKLFQSKYPTIGHCVWMSSLEEDGVQKFKKQLLKMANPGPHLYPHGDLSNKSIRFFVSEYIRESAFEFLKQELPHRLAVVVDEFNDLEADEDQQGKGIVAKIAASIIVDRPGQRAIVIGKGGRLIKEIGTAAREKIESLLGGQVALNLHVKVYPGWYKKNYILEELGLPRCEQSRRVWRKR